MCWDSASNYYQGLITSKFCSFQTVRQSHVQIIFQTSFQQISWPFLPPSCSELLQIYNTQEHTSHSHSQVIVIDSKNSLTRSLREGEAPLFSNTSTLCSWLFHAAHMRGERPSALTSFIRAPALMRKFMLWREFCLAAISSADDPLYLRVRTKDNQRLTNGSAMFGSAPLERSTSTTSGWFRSIAHKRAVRPH